MMQNSNISWTDHTFNPWIGCTKVSEGCKNCYAAADPKWSKHFGPTAERHITSEAYWKQPLRWNKKAAEEGKRYKVFCGSMCDVFEDIPGFRGKRGELWSSIVNTPNLDWLILTKRPENILNMIPYQHMGDHPRWLPPNAWIGTSVENQEQLRRARDLYNIPAKVRFISFEPQLEEIIAQGQAPDGFVYNWLEPGGIHWVICGAESGKNRRPFDVDWAISLYEQCKAANVPFFMKQDSAFRPGQQGRIPDWLWKIKQFPEEE